METQKKKLALVFGNVPTVEEIDQFQLISDQYDIKVVSSESICHYLQTSSYFNHLTCISLKDYDENPSYLPGLEKVLTDFDIVIVKERLGIYAYQAVKAKFRKRFRLILWCDNLLPFPAEDIDQLRTIRREVTDSADAFIVQSEAQKRTLKLEGVEEARIFSVRPYVKKLVNRDKKLRAEARRDLGFAEGDFVITHFGQIEQEEGLLDLITAVKLISLEDPSFARRIQIVLCGIGSYSAQLSQVMVRLGVDAQVSYVAPTRHSSELLLKASDALYLSTQASRDRVDGDPYRVLQAMVHEIPLIASRSAIIEEYCGKHRLDFCPGSYGTLGDALQKALSAEAIKHDIVKKNAAQALKLMNVATIKKSMALVIDGSSTRSTTSSQSIDHQVNEVESKIKNRQYIEAIDIIEALFRQNDVPVYHRANLFRLIGDCFAKLGDNENAKDSYMQAIELDPYNAKGHIGLGTIGLIKSSFDIAVLNFQKAVALAPEDDMASLGLGLAFQGMEELTEASRWILKSAEINIENTAALFSLVKIAYETNNFKDVDSILGRYLKLHPNDYNMLYTLGGVLFKKGEYAEVIAAMERIIKTDPMDVRAHTLLKQAQRAMDELKLSSGGAKA